MQVCKRFLAKLNVQSIIVTLCLLAVCIGTQQRQTGKWDTGIGEFSRDMLGVLMALILFTHYKWSDFTKYKLPYLIWSVVGGLGFVIATPIIVMKRYDFLAADTIIIALGIFLMGYCVIHTAISFFVEKYRPKFHKPLLIIWVVMLVWMIFSKSTDLWPECYFTLFLCFYLTPQTVEQRTNVIKGIINGIILGFLVIQGHSLLCRPYDVVRYKGNFCNPNHNSMFLCMCLVAILAKILFLTKEKKSIVERVFFFLMAGVCYSFIFMTQSRSGYMSVFVVTLFFLWAYCHMREKKVFLRTGLLLVLIFVVTMPLTYLAVRYIPTIHPHVVFYFQEGYSEDWVHSWDERDSEKFVSFDELMGSVFMRLESTQFQYTNIVGTAVEDIESDELLVASRMDYIPQQLLTSVATGEFVTDEEIETDPDKIPALTSEEAWNGFVVRYTIYHWYITHLSLRGMPYDEQGFQLTEDHWIQDTHSIYLDYGINFGYPAMILFTVFVFWGIAKLIRQGNRAKDPETWTCLLIVVLPPVFGMFEFAWGVGLLSTVAFYLAFKEIVNNNAIEPAEQVQEGV